MNRIFSGVQPTGNLHLGNMPRRDLATGWRCSASYECIFCIVDLHALTLPQDPDELRAATREVTAAYIAAGIDVEHCIIFNQSMVSAHAELGWLLSCLTPLGWLNRMTQFKEKAGKQRGQVAGLGLYAPTPVLMAADILGYKATHVRAGRRGSEAACRACRATSPAPSTGATRSTSSRCPEPQIFGEATRVMSLRDGTKKMSKSDTSDYSRINMTDDADTIALKFRKAKTDPEPLLPDSIAELEKRGPRPRQPRDGIYAALADESRDGPRSAASPGRKLLRLQRKRSDRSRWCAVLSGRIADEMRRLMADQAAHIDQSARIAAPSGRRTRSPCRSLREVQDITGLLAALRQINAEAARIGMGARFSRFGVPGFDAKVCSAEHAADVSLAGRLKQRAWTRTRAGIVRRMHGHLSAGRRGIPGHFRPARPRCVAGRVSVGPVRGRRRLSPG